MLSALPFPALYALASFLAFLAYRVFPYRQDVVRENLTKAFPDLDEAGLRAVMKRYYLGFAQVLVELIKAASLPPDEFLKRVKIRGLEAPRALLDAGKPVLLVAAHQCNWEWMLLGLSQQLGYRIDAAYKPLVNPWAEREMLAIRTRFGSRLVPAKTLLGDIIKHRKDVRAVCMVADQEPTTSEHKHWTRFLNRQTAFYMGAEEIARVTRYPAFFVGMRRVKRGYYEIDVQPLTRDGETLATGELTERYARLVEAQIRAAPPDWPWSHKRWRLKKGLYGKSG
ncbi:MAG TPA: lysophospholipid acyltransferase family protein [Steroidobacteraceae bacterium]|jgi:KDO2-lipid IV(A) lauroyltransferase|nr:lysophospholipid acyltransferase family protein [Steroidobacteraceae bacterium]